MNYGTTDGALLAVTNAAWCVMSDGDVMAPTGYCSLIEIPAHVGERAEMRDAVFSDDTEAAEAFDALTPGWYVLRQGETGFLESVQLMEKSALAAYRRLIQEFHTWAETSETNGK